jgi:murein DD-endopeptidase MepM/ murein hydrolase activator NlpD
VTGDTAVTEAAPVVPEAAPAPEAAAPAEVDTPSQVTVISGEYLRLIAQRNLGNEMSWPQIYALNKDKIRNPNLIYPGQILNLPQGRHRAAETDDTVPRTGDLPPVPAPAASAAPVTEPAPAAPVEPAPAPEAAPAPEVAPVPAVTASGYANPCPACAIGQAFKGAAHQGIDMPAPIGTRVNAAAAGTVWVAGPRDPNGFGQAVYIHGDDGNDYWYGHIDTWTTSVGAHVEAGEQIATVGNRGSSTGPHLHFEVHLGGANGARVSPLPFLREQGVNI